MNSQTSGAGSVYDNSGYGSAYRQPGLYAGSAGIYPVGADVQSATAQTGTMQTTGQAGPMMQLPMQADTAPITDLTQPAPMTMESTEYLNGFLRTQIGKRIRAEFLIGTNTYTDKMGKLLDVGANFILLQEAMTDDILTCDFYSIKFITIYE